MEEERHITHGLTPEELRKLVVEGVDKFPFGYDQFYDRMRLRLRIGGSPLESAIRDAFVVDERRITGLKPSPSEDSPKK
ncbi:MAG: hypothetical protein NTZ07_01680 [Candidatus Woesebacteria bacterium]|nr:hypothetical protein [Candidatus Woesebacteria bacterium]